MESKKFRILFVCSGNSCRSPMAEGLLRAKLPDELKEHVDVQSAGTLGINGNPATEFAIMVANELGADISEHRSQGVTKELIRESDIIFAMAPEHKEFLQHHFPEARENIFLLRSFDRDPEEKHLDRIDDPIGSPLEVYQECGALINSELDRIFPRLKQMIEDKLGEKGAAD